MPEPSERVAVITGAAGGIGSACARLLHGRGWRVVGWDVAPPSETVGGVDWQAVDVADPAQVAAAAASIERVDLLINAAGITSFGPAAQVSAEAWRQVVGVNLDGPFLCATRLHGALRAAGGTVVNIGSITALRAGNGRAGYCSSKAAVLTLTQVLASEWARDGIRVVAVSPGYTRTEMVRQALLSGDLDHERILGRIPQGRMAEPEEMAEVIVALAGDPFRHVTGGNLVVDGGWLANGAY